MSEIHIPMMGWQSCRYVLEAPGDDGMDDYYRCTVHGAVTIGHEVSCELAETRPIVSAAHELRSEHPGWPARTRVQHARWLAGLEPVPWEHDHRGGYVATWEHDGWEIRARLEMDADEPDTDGCWSETWEPGAIVNPAWANTWERSRSYHYWHPESPATLEDRASFSRAGMARHDAWLACVALDRSTLPDYAGGDAGEPYLATVTVTRAGVGLARNVRGVGRVAGNARTDTWTMAEVRELARETVGDAETALAALVAS